MLASLRAQVTWSTVGTPTTETLWGVTYGSGQFVAVGEKGVILTSPDARVWTKRASGTDAWLLHVAYGDGCYAAVGEAGTILVSVDAIHWQRSEPIAGLMGTARERLNVVAYRRVEFFAFGENGERASAERPFGPWSRDLWKTEEGSWWRGYALGFEKVALAGSRGIYVDGTDRTPGGLRNLEGVAFGNLRFVAVGAGGATAMSMDGESWAAGDAGTSQTLRAVTYFNGLFVAVGDGGAVRTSPDGRSWVARNSSTLRGLRGLSTSDNTVVAVGEAGALISSPWIGLAPAVVRPMENVREEEGGTTYLRVEATGSEPLSYRWSFQGSQIAVTKHPLLDLSNLTPSQAGLYTVTVSNAYGSATSAPASVTVLPVAGPSVVDANFNASATVEQAPTAVLPLVDGRVLVAGGRTGELVRLQSNGTADPGFAVVRVSEISTTAVPAEVRALAVQPDGRILVGGRFSLVNAEPTGRLIRLQADGNLDRSFVAAPEASEGTGVRDIKVQPDGRIVIANGSSRIRRLLSNGSLDPSFSSREIPGADANPKLLFHTLALSPDGKIVAGGSYAGPSENAGPVRFHADGALDRQLVTGLVDPSRPPFGYESVGSTLSPYETDALTVLADGRMLAAGTRWFRAFHSITTNYFQHLTRYLPSGERDLSYIVEPDGLGTSDVRYWERAWFYPDGRALLSGRFQSPGYGPYAWNAVIRLSADGVRDESLGGATALNWYHEGGITQLAADSAGKILVGGNYTLLNRFARRALNRLNSGVTEGLFPPTDVLVTASTDSAGVGSPVTLTVSVRGSGQLWRNEGRNLFGPPFSWTVSGPGNYGATMVNARGVATGSIRVADSKVALAPVITSQSPAISSQSGRDVVLQVKATAPEDPRYDPGLVYEWRRNGEWLGYSYGDWHLPSIAAAQAGTYTVWVRDRFGNATPGVPMVVTVDDTSRFINLSARAWVGPGYLNAPGEQGLFTGFVIPGPEKRKVLIRGLGPTLRRFGVGSPLEGTQLAVVAGDGRTVAFNAGWDAFPFSSVAAKPVDFMAVGAFALEPGTQDSAVVVELAPGAYTASLNGTFDFANQKPGVGVGLIELYEYDNRSDRLSNLSARVMVGVGGEAAIPGFAVRGPVAKRLLVRAVGPGLAAFGIGAPLANPRLEVRDEGGRVVVENEDWNDDLPGAAAVRQAGASVGAFALAEGSRDAARVVTVSPGNYTLVVNGPPGASGIALVEVYELP
ncbi:MAG: hypothetical protein JNJ82_23775 [Opitutaceae bacterium]|nr:hypothetical protein [Opitutaceae bacterium]